MNQNSDLWSKRASTCCDPLDFQCLQQCTTNPLYGWAKKQIHNYTYILTYICICILFLSPPFIRFITYSDVFQIKKLINNYVDGDCGVMGQTLFTHALIFFAFVYLRMMSKMFYLNNELN